ncbi:MAG: helix-turn-helix transcriptional regulator [Oscillospiraceae bacterium]|nr:helix-turn-helix transcriptional regulator [Oscillospiraceae bacterium]
MTEAEVNKERTFLREARQAKGLKQVNVARLAEITAGAYRNIEAGRRNPSVKCAKKIGEIVGVDWTLFYK